MSNPIFAADALAITSSKSANFPLSFEIIKDNHQNALQTTWQILQTLGQAIDDYHATHGKLILCQFKEDIKAEAAYFHFTVWMMEKLLYLLRLAWSYCLIFKAIFGKDWKPSPSRSIFYKTYRRTTSIIFEYSFRRGRFGRQQKIKAHEKCAFIKSTKTRLLFSGFNRF